MLKNDVRDKQCPKCSGLGKTVNPTRKKLSIVESKPLENLDNSTLFVCTECNGTGIILPDDVKELLEYILS